MAEGAEERIGVDRGEHRGGGGDAAAQLLRGLTAVRGPFAVEAQVGEGQVDLAQGGRPTHEGAGRLQLGELSLG